MTKAIQAGRARIDAPCETTDSPAFPASYEAPPELRVRGIPDGKGRSIVAGASALALAACGGGGSGSGSGGSAGGTPTPAVNIRKPQSAGEAARFTLSVGIGTSPTRIAAVQSEGFAPWLDAQMKEPIAQTGLAWLQTRGYSTVDANKYYNMAGLMDRMIWNQLMTGADQVRKRAALALSEIMVVSINGITGSWRAQAMAQYWDILNARAFGNFRDLLEDITLNPAMGYFLNTKGNRKEDPRTGRVPDENYAREVMQLFTIGLYELNIDGTWKTDGSGHPIETYTNADIEGLAKVFTGYDLDFTNAGRFPNPDDPTKVVYGIEPVVEPMTADHTRFLRPPRETYHSPAEKSFLGTTIPAGTSAQETLRIALDTLFNHPNVGPFIGRQLIQRLVTSNPSNAYVARVAAAFNNNGSGVRGDLRAVFKAVWLDDEALASGNQTSVTFGKLREPILRLAQWGRTFGATSASGNWLVGDTSDVASELGQSPLRSPSVFNFFRPGYVPANSNAANASLVAPEFQIVNETTTPAYVNFMSDVINRGWGSARDVKAQYSAEIAMADDPPALVDHLDAVLTGSRLSPGNRGTILAAIQDVPIGTRNPDSDRMRRVVVGVLLTMVAPEYLVQV
ncbi:MAG: DUF1800 domain-containing protein [Erythrobacter sp.]|nr:DUF1800 domain-containing protein [Erythrobacter sp.]NCQ63770.1 DUF1800 domain-containing protein [Alphaproteobacteria bacterium]